MLSFDWRAVPCSDAACSAWREQYLLLSLISRISHEVRYWVFEHAAKATTRTIIEGNVPPNSTILYTDEANNDEGVMALELVSARCIAPVVKGQAPRCVRSCAHSGLSTHTIWPLMCDVRNDREYQTHHPIGCSADVFRWPDTHEELMSQVV